MTDLSMYNALEDVFERINRVVDSDIETVDASETIQHLTKDGGGIEVVGDSFGPRHERPVEISERAPPYNYTYGVDGSTTKDMSFNNGLIMSAAVAKLGVAGKDTKSSLSEKSTISVVPYFGEQDIDITEPDGDDKTLIHVNQFPTIDRRTRDLSSWINSVSRTYAEGSHLRWTADDIDAPLFVDGPIFPPTIFLWTLYDQVDADKRTAMDVWPDMVRKIMQSYVSSVEQFRVNQQPIFGIQKSTTATRVLEALETKSPELRGNMPWNDDGQLFFSALSPEDGTKSVMSYTPWYVENQVNLGRLGHVTPFEQYDGIQLKYSDPEYYTRCFFFVRPPMQTTVFRIGVPTLIVDNPYSLDELRDIALTAMGEQYREPTAVELADSRARIPMQLRNRLRQLITSQEKIGRKEQRGADNFRGDDR